MKKSWFLVICLLLSACYRQETQVIENPSVEQTRQNVQTQDQAVPKIKQARQSVVQFFRPMGKPQPMDWLANNQESGQTFEEYLSASPMLPTEQRKVIYIQPIGNFTSTQKKIISLTAEYMQAFYNLPVRLQAEKSLGNVPQKFIRKNQWSGQEQVETTYFLNALLPSMIPKDAAAFICFTNSDLYPSEKWSFVFGMASLQKRIGVWSIYRFGNPDKSPQDYKLFLTRTLKIAIHETGHMFTMQHCTKYECLMSGTNNLEETDRRPVDNCPECMAKIAWAMKYEPQTRYRNLSQFWARQANHAEANLFTKKADAIKNICVFCN